MPNPMLLPGHMHWHSTQRLNCQPRAYDAILRILETLGSLSSSHTYRMSHVAYLGTGQPTARPPHGSLVGPFLWDLSVCPPRIFPSKDVEPRAAVGKRHEISRVGPACCIAFSYKRIGFFHDGSGTFQVGSRFPIYVCVVRPSFSILDPPSDPFRTLRDLRRGALGRKSA